MRQVAKSVFLTLLFVIISILFYSPIQNVYAQDAGDAVCSTLQDASNNSGCDEASTGITFKSVVTSILKLLSFAAGMLAVIMVIYAGVQFITSQGDPGKVSSARHTTMYAIIGLIIVVMAQTIIFFVLDNTVNP